MEGGGDREEEGVAFTAYHLQGRLPKANFCKYYIDLLNSAGEKKVHLQGDIAQRHTFKVTLTVWPIN